MINTPTHPTTSEWKSKIVMVELPERLEIKPVGRITLFGKQLTAKQTKNYIKAL